MKTLTITLHDTDNCGSSLQAFSLQKFLLSNGIDNEIIDYVPEYAKNNGSPIKSLLRKLIFYRDSNERDKKFHQFVVDYLHLTEKKYRSFQELDGTPLEADFYITGSDQLWNATYRCGNDPAFYLDFVKTGKKLAYAVSLGREVIPKDNLELVKKYAQDYQWLSVREKSSVKQLEGVLNGKRVDYVCDPVLLNTVEIYLQMQAPRLIKDPYILVYMAQIPDAPSMDAFIEAIQKKVNGKVVLIGSYRNRCACDIHKRDVAPAEFLSLIANAEYIISNSFHATMFSMIYEKQFATVLPERNGTRIKEILDYTDLTEHAISSISVPWIEDYTEVRNKLAHFRTQSQQILLNELGK